MIPLWIAAYLLRVSAMGARQFVVHEAAEMILSSMLEMGKLRLKMRWMVPKKRVLHMEGMYLSKRFDGGKNGRLCSLSVL